MWKVTLYLSDPYGTWTEVYYLPAAFSFISVQTNAGQIATARAGMLTTPCVITAVRITLLTNPRFSYFLPAGQFAGSAGFNFFPATNPDQDSAPNFVAVLTKLFGVNNHVSRRYFGGAPEGIVGSGPGTTRNLEALGAWGNALSNFINVLSLSSAQFRFNNSTLVQVNTLTTSAQFPSLIGISLLTQIVPPGTAKPQVYLNGFRSLNPARAFGLRGVYTIDPNSPGFLPGAVSPYVYYLRNTANVTSSNIVQIGKAGLLSYSFEQYAGLSGGAGYSVVKAAHRKRGVSALAARGKSRTRP